MTASSFQERLSAAKKGDEASFTELFRSVQPQLLRYLRAMGGELAEDAAAETWVSVVRGLHRFKGDDAGWRGWVFTIARARLVDAQRRAGRTAVPVDAEAMLEGTAGNDDVVDSVEEMFSTEAALALVARLPKEQAEVVLLRHVAGLDVKQTAEILGKRPGAVRVASHRGLHRLEQILSSAPGSQSSRRCNANDSVFGR
ncbi:MAG: RNA polymerase sigma factor [Nocardioidaceae bacterium]